jgi:anti-sigma regulatory factor (Ser/Thr protein kinase)
MSPPNRWWVHPPPDAFTLTYRSAVELHGLREAAARYAVAAGMAAGLVPRMVVSVNELATNTLRYTSGPGVLRMWSADDLLVQVSDTGTLPESVAALGPSFSAQPIGRGHGLALAAAFSDQMVINPDPVTIRMRFRLK